MKKLRKMINKNTFIFVKEFAVVSCLLIAILTVFFSPSLFPGQVLSPADGLFSTPFFAEKAPLGFNQESNQLLFDQVYQFTPWRHFAWKSLNQGLLPVWNPYSSAGTPFIATMQSAVFYPVNLILLFIPFEYTMVVSAFLRLWIAGICTYLLVRYYGLGMVASLVSSLSFMLSGFLIVWLGHPHTNVAIWLPALLFLAEALLQAAHRNKIFLIGSILALVIGFQFLGGHIETSVNVLSCFMLYYLIRWAMIIFPESHSMIVKLKYLIVFPGASVFLGTALAAIQLVPFLEWLPLSNEFHSRGGLVSSFQFLDTKFWRELFELPVILFPNLYNNPTWNDYPYWSFLPGGNYNEDVLYVGTLTLILAVIAIIVGWKKEPMIKVWTLIGLISFGRAFHLPIFDWINQLPVLSLGDANRLRLISAFSLCILSGFGVEILSRHNHTKQKLADKFWVWGCSAVIGIGLIILVAGNTILPVIQDQIRAYGREQVITELASRSSPPQHPMEYYYAQVDEMVDGLLAAFRFDNFSMYIPIFLAIAGLIILIWSRKSNQRTSENLKHFILILVIIDLISFGRAYNPSISLDNFYPRTSIIQKITADSTLFRFTALRQDLIPDAQMMFDIQDTRGLDFPTYWYNQYLDLISDRIPWLGYGTMFSSVDSPLLKNLNIKYIAASNPDIFNQSKDIEIIAQEKEIYLGQVVNVSPRAYMVYDAIIAESDDDALEILNREPESVSHRVILSDVERPSLFSPAEEQIDRKEPVATVSVVDYGANQSTWKISTNKNGYLFVSDSYYPGWNAYLNNQSTELYRANIAFRAVYIPEGVHTVSFKYEPISIYIGAIISLLSFIVLIIINSLFIFR